MIKKLLFTLLIMLFLVPAELSFAAFVVKDKVENTPPILSNEVSKPSIKDALKEFDAFSRKEKKSRYKEMKKAIREYKEARKAGGDASTNTLLLVLLSLFIPPLAVYLHEGDTNNRFWISVLLTVIGYVLFGFAGIFFLGSLPGIIYALIVVLGS